MIEVTAIKSTFAKERKNQYMYSKISLGIVCSQKRLKLDDCLWFQQNFVHMIHTPTPFGIQSFVWKHRHRYQLQHRQQ